MKTWPQFFEQTRNGTKRFELRRNDRDFRVGDQLLLKEWSPETVRNGSGAVVTLQGYTGRELMVRVDYIMDASMVTCLMSGQWFDEAHPDEQFVIMSVSLVN